MTTPAYACRRQHERRSIRVDAIIATQGRLGAGCTRDISLGGAFIETEAPLPYGTECEIELRAPTGAFSVRVSATVRWVAPDGMGVQWASLGARESWTINTLLRS